MFSLSSQNKDAKIRITIFFSPIFRLRYYHDYVSLALTALEWFHFKLMNLSALNLVRNSKAKCHVVSLSNCRSKHRDHYDNLNNSPALMYTKRQGVHADRHTFKLFDFPISLPQLEHRQK